MTTFNEAVRAVQSTLGTKQDTLEWQPAMLGDGKGTVSTGNNMCYVRLMSNSSVIEVLNLRCAPVDGLLVRIAKTPEMPLVWQVIGQADQRADENGNSGGGVNYNTPLHAALHGYLAVDQVSVDWRQISTLRVYVVSGFTIGILAGLLPRAGSDLVVPSQTLNLVAHVPASGALYLLISVDSSGALAATPGIAVASRTLLTLSDIPDTPAGNFRLAAVRLYAGQAALSESTTTNDLRDLRWPQERLAGDVLEQFGAQAANTYLAGPVSGSDAAPTFRAGDADDIASGVFPIDRGGTNADNAIDALNNLLPTQSGQDGNVLGTDGTNASWVIGGGGGGGGTIVMTTLPVGTIVPFGGSSIPSGWLECNGAAVSRTTYADLFTVIGTTYGTGDGSTTFNLPDLRGRVSIGKGTGSGLTPRALGAAGGAETHTLTESEIPAHTHIVEHATDGSGPVGGAILSGTPSLDSTIMTSATGGGASHNNLPPFLVTAWIIKFTNTATADLIFDDNVAPEDVALTAGSGADVYAARRDHVHALDQGIAPTWTAQHRFNLGLQIISN
jgi:microcystin-dependent protein